MRTSRGSVASSNGRARGALQLSATCQLRRSSGRRGGAWWRRLGARCASSGPTIVRLGTVAAEAAHLRRDLDRLGAVGAALCWLEACAVTGTGEQHVEHAFTPGLRSELEAVAAVAHDRVSFPAGAAACPIADGGRETRDGRESGFIGRGVGGERRHPCAADGEAPALMRSRFAGLVERTAGAIALHAHSLALSRASWGSYLLSCSFGRPRAGRRLLGDGGQGVIEDAGAVVASPRVPARPPLSRAREGVSLPPLLGSPP